MENKYYVYKFCYEDGRIFYIGMGSGKRYKCVNPNGRNKKFLEIIKDNKYYSEIIQKDLSYEKALELENRLIKDLPNLCNVLFKLNVNEKKCSSCEEVKPIADFSNNSAGSAKCKKCLYEYNRKYIKKKISSDSDKDYQSKYYEDNKEELLSKMKIYQYENKERQQEYRKKYYLKKKLEKEQNNIEGS